MKCVYEGAQIPMKMTKQPSCSQKFETLLSLFTPITNNLADFSLLRIFHTLQMKPHSLPTHHTINGQVSVAAMKLVGSGCEATQ